ncbi:uncharacterized protein [Primulina huaijiensis]|uniref:uncharacterized protein isoform X2 n=1 Tax=Primulina huaijiensis TaxID=1492673 RepID=UPI003CC76143
MLGNMQNRGKSKIVGHMFHRGITACDECTKNCFKIHHPEQRGPSSTVSRFFKIMHGKHWSDFLYLPPKFARDVSDLVGQKTQIEDSNGQKWTVRFSHVDDLLVFQEGWHKFVEDHQLEHGEILVFNYVNQRHFVVEIYGLSACEITDFNRGRKLQKKRSRSDQGTVFHDEPHQIRNKQFTTFKNSEDPSLLDRDSGKYYVEDREFLFDLSNFEMGKNSSVAEKSETSLDRNITHVETQIREQIEVMRNDAQMSMPLKDKKNNHLYGISTDAFQTEPSGDSNSSKDMPYDVSKFQAGETENNSSHGISSDALQNKLSVNSDSSKGIPDEVSEFQAGEMENNGLYGIFSDALQKAPSGNSDSPEGMTDVIKFGTGVTNNYRSYGIFSDVFRAKSSNNSDSGKDMFDDVSKFQAFKTSVSPRFIARGKSAATFKKEVVELGEEVYGFPLVSSGITSTFGMKRSQIPSPIVKTEPDMADVFVPAVATSPFSAEVKSLAFLELPLCMPSIQGKRERGRGKVVYLKNSSTRLWPVLYPGKSFVKAFTDGWKTFCKGNNIRARDVCSFQLETYMPCVFKVIIRKAGLS